MTERDISTGSGIKKIGCYAYVIEAQRYGANHYEYVQSLACKSHAQAMKRAVRLIDSLQVFDPRTVRVRRVSSNIFSV